MAGAHITRCAQFLAKTLLQHFNRSACFQIYMGRLFHTKTEQWTCVDNTAVGIILITSAHGCILV